MSKTITLRLSDQEYAIILEAAKKDRRPISNYISHIVLEKLDGASTKITTPDQPINQIEI